MASGKSTYARAVAKMLGLPCFSMDQMRTRAWANGVKGGGQRETRARQLLSDAIDRNTAFVMERTGTGEFDQAILHKLMVGKRKTMRVLIHATATTCAKRRESRGDHRAYPLPDWMTDPEGYIYQTADRLDDLKRREVYKIVIGNDANKTAKKLGEEAQMIAQVARVYFEKEMVDGGRL